MPGYSGTPLPKKLGIKNGFRAYFVNLPKEVEAELQESITRCEIVAKASSLDFAMIFVSKKSGLPAEFKRLARALTPAGMLWVSWPKKSSGVASDLNENMVRETGLDAGLVDVKVCAVSEIWSGLKFVRRLKDR
jgi:hypothetical protein